MRCDPEVTVKETTYDALLEADGLRALAEAGAPVPAVLEATSARLVMTTVSGGNGWAALGRSLASLHRTVGPSFGWRHDNVIGPLPQSNTWTEDWPGFYIEHRLRPWMDAVSGGLRDRLDRVCDTVLPRLLDHHPVPSLVHGDLWSGNVVDGSWLIDPAVSYSDREVDLAFATLFGGIQVPFFDAYHDTWPLDPGWKERRPALQLYHLLVHIELFGSTYVPLLEDRLAAVET